jgi:NitT/TauT family transport system ATP-binding protein
MDGFVAVTDASLNYQGDPSETPAVSRLSLEIASGEFAAVVGPSGCGKSTLMKLVSGLVRPTVGSVMVDRIEVKRPIKIVGMAFQNPALLPWRTTLENVLLPIQVVRPHRYHFRRDRAAFEEKARKLLAMVGLSGASDLYGWQLSGGMQQRVSLCRALIHEPEVLLLDEPFSALDAFTREELWDTLQALWLQRKCTVLLVTHDLTEAVYLADTIHVMSARPGRIIYKVKVDLARPRAEDTRFTATFTELVHDVRRRIKHGTEPQ